VPWFRVNVFAPAAPTLIAVAAPNALTVVATVLYKFCVVLLPTKVPGRSVTIAVVALPMFNVVASPNALTVVAVVLTKFTVALLLAIVAGTFILPASAPILTSVPAKNKLPVVTVVENIHAVVWLPLIIELVFRVNPPVRVAVLAYMSLQRRAPEPRS
jgi:hypothetical protein